MYNLHPIFIHFPIALLTVYALMECVKLKKFTNDIRWNSVKIVLLMAGFLATIPAKLTGEALEDELRQDRVLGRIIPFHSFFADVTIVLFGILAVSYAIKIIKEKNPRFLIIDSPLLNRLWKFAQSAAALTTSAAGSLIIALAGLATLTITGALGGGMVYGSSVDPMVKLVFRLLNLE